MAGGTGAGNQSAYFEADAFFWLLKKKKNIVSSFSVGVCDLILAWYGHRSCDDLIFYS